MNGIILSGGVGTRLHPLTKATNKHSLPVGREPMLYHAVRQLVDAGIRDILTITNTLHMGDVVRCLRGGEEFGCTLSYKVQREPKGIAHALSLAEHFVDSRKICVILADNVFECSIAPYVEAFAQQTSGPRVLLKEVGDPERYGVAALDDHQILAIEEKPANPKSSFAVFGLYFFDNDVFDAIRAAKPSARGELEITEIINTYIGRHELQYSICKGRWTDAGTFESLLEANQISTEKGNRILPHADALPRQAV